MLLERWRDLPEYERLAELAMARPSGAGYGSRGKELKWLSRSWCRNTARVAGPTNYCEKREELGLNYDEKAELSLLLNPGVVPERLP